MLDSSLIALYALVVWFGACAIFFCWRWGKAVTELKALKTKFKLNPSYETQLFMADMLRSGALFHIERLPPEDVLIRRS